MHLSQRARQPCRGERDDAVGSRRRPCRDRVTLRPRLVVALVVLVPLGLGRVRLRHLLRCTHARSTSDSTTSSAASAPLVAAPLDERAGSNADRATADHRAGPAATTGMAPAGGSSARRFGTYAELRSPIGTLGRPVPRRHLDGPPDVPATSTAHDHRSPPGRRAAPATGACRHADPSDATSRLTSSSWPYPLDDVPSSSLPR